MLCKGRKKPIKQQNKSVNYFTKKVLCARQKQFFLKKNRQSACQFKNNAYLCNANDKTGYQARHSRLQKE
jgi:hypothetical protein